MGWRIYLPQICPQCIWQIQIIPADQQRRYIFIFDSIARRNRHFHVHIIIEIEPDLVPLASVLFLRQLRWNIPDFLSCLLEISTNSWILLELMIRFLIVISLETGFRREGHR